MRIKATIEYNVIPKDNDETLDSETILDREQEQLFDFLKIVLPFVKVEVEEIT